MSDNLPYTFPYLYSTEFRVPSLIERLELEYSIHLPDSLILFQNESDFFSGDLRRARPLNVFSFSVKKLSGKADTFSLVYDEICTMEIQNYHPENMENCTVVLTGTDEQNERFLNILISVFPSSDLMIKEPEE